MQKVAPSFLYISSRDPVFPAVVFIGSSAFKVTDAVAGLPLRK